MRVQMAVARAAVLIVALIVMMWLPPLRHPLTGLLFTAVMIGGQMLIRLGWSRWLHRG
jgi:hypothetical protein